MDTPRIDFEDDPSRCYAITKRGTRCKSAHLKNSLYCYWHGNPEGARAAGRKGGISRANKPFEVHTNIRDIYDLATFLEAATARVAEALKVMGGK
jgi:hypothetical protein